MIGAENGPVYRVEHHRVHQLLDAFELRVLARPAPKVKVSTLQAAVESLHADIYIILEASVAES